MTQQHDQKKTDEEIIAGMSALSEACSERGLTFVSAVYFTEQNKTSCAFTFGSELLLRGLIDSGRDYIIKRVLEIRR